METREADNRYLLRVWRDGQADRAWRATLRDVRDGSVRSFLGLDELVDFLETAPRDTSGAGLR